MPKNANYTPNEMRSNANNPNNPAHAAQNGNRGGQLNPQHPNYGAGKSDAGDRTEAAPVVPSTGK